MSQVKATKKSFLISFLTWFALFYIVLWGLEKWLVTEPEPQAGPLEARLLDQKLVLGQVAVARFTNQDQVPYQWTGWCEQDQTNPEISRVVNGQTLPIFSAENCPETSQSVVIPAGEKRDISFLPITAAIFTEAGEYQFQWTWEAQGVEPTSLVLGLSYVEPGLFRQLFRALITQPLFNILVFLVEHLPGHSLGWAIILLTILVRLILWGPNQKALKSQRQLQILQPKIEALRQKYQGNQQQMALKMMELYKTHQINPLSSLWPILLQLPIMLGVYLVIKDGLSPHLSYLLYDFHQDLDWSLVNSFFVIWDLTQPEWIVLPILVGVAQWIALWLSFRRQKNSPAPLPSTMQKMQGFMQWGLPVMIAFFTATFPAGVGLYWLVSTVFGVGQQWWINYRLDQTFEAHRKVD